MKSTSVGDLAQAKITLINHFNQHGKYISPEDLKILCPRMPAKLLRNLGYLEPTKFGRWAEGYAPTDALYQ